MNGKDTSGEVALRCYTGGAFSAEFQKFRTNWCLISYSGVYMGEITITDACSARGQSV